MTPEENVAVIQQMLEAFERGDIQTIVDNNTPDCEVYMPGPNTIPHAGKHTGRQAIVNNFFGPIMRTQTNQRLTVERFVAQGDTVVVIGHYRAIVTATGKTAESPIALIFDLENGKVKRNLLNDTAAGVEAYTGAAAAAPGRS